MIAIVPDCSRARVTLLDLARTLLKRALGFESNAEKVTHVRLVPRLISYFPDIEHQIQEALVQRLIRMI
jgi:hypothetical protein